MGMEHVLPVHLFILVVSLAHPATRSVDQSLAPKNAAPGSQRQLHQLPLIETSRQTRDAAKPLATVKREHQPVNGASSRIGNASVTQCWNFPCVDDRAVVPLGHTSVGRASTALNNGSLQCLVQRSTALEGTRYFREGALDHGRQSRDQEHRDRKASRGAHATTSATEHATSAASQRRWPPLEEAVPEAEGEARQNATEQEERASPRSGTRQAGARQAKKKITTTGETRDVTESVETIIQQEQQCVNHASRKTEFVFGIQRLNFQCFDSDAEVSHSDTSTDRVPTALNGSSLQQLAQHSQVLKARRGFREGMFNLAPESRDQANKYRTIPRSVPATTSVIDYATSTASRQWWLPLKAASQAKEEVWQNTTVQEDRTGPRKQGGGTGQAGSGQVRKEGTTGKQVVDATKRFETIRRGQQCAKNTNSTIGNTSAICLHLPWIDDNTGVSLGYTFTDTVSTALNDGYLQQLMQHDKVFEAARDYQVGIFNHAPESTDQANKYCTTPHTIPDIASVTKFATTNTCQQQGMPLETAPQAKGEVRYNAPVQEERRVSRKQGDAAGQVGTEREKKNQREAVDSTSPAEAMDAAVVRIPHPWYSVSLETMLFSTVALVAGLWVWSSVAFATDAVPATKLQKFTKQGQHQLPEKKQMAAPENQKMLKISEALQRSTKERMTQIIASALRKSVAKALNESLILSSGPQNAAMSSTSKDKTALAKSLLSNRQEGVLLKYRNMLECAVPTQAAETNTNHEHTSTKIIEEVVGKNGANDRNKATSNAKQLMQSTVSEAKGQSEESDMKRIEQSFQKLNTIVNTGVKGKAGENLDNISAVNNDGIQKTHLKCPRNQSALTGTKSDASIDKKQGEYLKVKPATIGDISSTENARDKHNEPFSSTDSLSLASQCCHWDDGDIYAQLNCLERNLDNELHGLKEFGIGEDNE